MPSNVFYAIQVVGASLATGWLALFVPLGMSALALGAATKKPKPALRAVIYIRISRDRPTEVSMAVQERDCRNYALMKGWEVTFVYRDRGIGAAKTSTIRPGYERLQRDVEAGLVDVVIIWKLDRLGRSVVELARIADRLKAKKVDLVSVNDSIDTSTPGGRFVYTVLSAVAQLESEQISLRVSAAASQRARNGQRHGGGSRTYGYHQNGKDRRDKKGDVRPCPTCKSMDLDGICDPEVVLIHEAARRLLAGASPGSVGRDWNARKIPTPTRKGKWWPAAIVRILMNDQVAGLRRVDGDEVKGNWDAIISPELRGELLERFADPYNRSKKYTHSLLNGVLYCGLCKKRLSLSGKTSRRTGEMVPKYRCRREAEYGGCGRTHVIGAPLDRYVRDIVFVALTDPGFRKAMETGRALEDLEALEADIVDIEERLRELSARYGQRKITTAEYDAGRIPLKEELEEKQAELRGAQAAAAPDAPDVPRTIPELEAWWRDADQLDRRALVRSVIARVDVGPPTRPGPFDSNRVTITPRE